MVRISGQFNSANRHVRFHGSGIFFWKKGGKVNMTHEKGIRRYFGDRQFYRNVMIVAVPLIIQQLITSFVNMLDNIMVGQTGTLQMSAVSVANQLCMIFNLAVFGSISGAGIFGAQFAGKKDWEGSRYTLRFKLITELLFSVLGILLFLTMGNTLLGLFMTSEANSAADAAMTLQYASTYIRIMTVGFIPFALSQTIGSSIRETGNTRLPMIASITAVFVNFIGNYILIFGKFGFPALGCTGAAVATVISRFAEFGMNLYFAIRGKDDFPFFHGVFRDFRIPLSLTKQIIVRGFPLVVNEVLWSSGIAAIIQCYSTRGIDALAAYNICNTINNLFFVFSIAMGDCISIMVGQKLGAGKLDEAVETDLKLIMFTFLLSVCLGSLLVCTGNLFPMLYNTGDEIRHTATVLLRTAGCLLPIQAMYNACYFTMRCGGKTIITFLFDSVGTIAVSFPVAFVLSRFTTLPITMMYFIVTVVDLYKVILGLFLVHKRMWVNNLIENA